MLRSVRNIISLRDNRELSNVIKHLLRPRETRELDNMADKTEIIHSLKAYIDAGLPMDFVVKRQLASIKSDDLHTLLTDVRGERYAKDNAITTAARIRDFDDLRCMLECLTQEQRLALLKIGDSDGSTPMLCAVYGHHDDESKFSSAEVVKYLLGSLPCDRQFQLLKRGNVYGNTLLHVAMAYNDTGVIRYVIDTQPWEHFAELLHMKNKERQSAGDTAVPVLFGILQERKDTKAEVECLKRKYEEQNEVIKKLDDRLKQLDVCLREMTVTDESVDLPKGHEAQNSISIDKDAGEN